jgi:hypothetical protein
MFYHEALGIMDSLLITVYASLIALCLALTMRLLVSKGQLLSHRLYVHSLCIPPFSRCWDICMHGVWLGGYTVLMREALWVVIGQYQTDMLCSKANVILLSSFMARR